MSIDKLANLLESAAGPDRTIDLEVAKFLYARTGRRPTKEIPRYTANVDDACDFVGQIAPSTHGGFGWEPDKASARLGTGLFHEAAHPAIALCLAAVRACN